MTRQKRVGQYGWLVLAVFVASFLWMYFDTVNKTTASKQITSIQTLPVVESKAVVLSLTLSDGDNIQYPGTGSIRAIVEWLEQHG